MTGNLYLDWQRVCVSVRERGGEREKLRERGRDTERLRERGREVREGVK